MTHRLFAALSVLVCVTACGKRIEGQVFIVTAGGPNIKLALVQVKAIPKIEMENHIAKIEQQIASERAEVNSAVSRMTKEMDKEMQDAQEAISRQNLHEMMTLHNAMTKRMSERDQSEKLLARKKTLNSAAPFLVDLPQPVATAKTDADGRFELTIPDQRRICASGECGTDCVE